VTAAVALADAGRRFGRRWALTGVTLEVATGEVFGLAGPNGSGKTTLLELLAGLSAPSRGSVRVLGLDPFVERRAVMRRARFAFAPPALYDGLDALEHLRYLCALGGARPTPAAMQRALEWVGLADRARDRVGTYSYGMRQRLLLAQALCPRPDLLVLDEPADGLDPLAVLELRAILARMRAEEGVTIVLSSHLLLELDELVDRLLVLDEGQALFLGTPDELRGSGEQQRLTVDDPAAACAALAERGLAARAGEGAVFLAPGALDLEGARALLASRGLQLAEFTTERPSLERALLARLRARREAVSS
jgi:ABC-2 type transport system ATP-binding protein